MSILISCSTLALSKEYVFSRYPETNITELERRMGEAEMENGQRKMEIGDLDIRSTENNQNIETNTNAMNDKVINFECPIDGNNEESGLGIELCSLQTQVNQLEFLPLGSILPWVMKPSPDTNNDLVVDLPDGNYSIIYFVCITRLIVNVIEEIY